MRLRPIALVLFLTATSPAVAHAARLPPKTVPSAIVLNQQIGAMKLGMTRSQALKAWGEQGDCQAFEPFERFCFWSDEDGQASVRFDARKVGSIQILATPPSKGGHLRRFNLGGGVALGSAKSLVRRVVEDIAGDGKVTIGTKGPSKGNITVTNPAGTRSTSFLFTGERLTGVVMQRISTSK